jgi:hypothetical protein
MTEFVKQNLKMILLLSGAVIPFLLALYERFTERKSLRIVLLLLSAGFIIPLTNNIVGEIQKRTSEQINKDAEARKQSMIQEISQTVVKNLDLSKQSFSVLKGIESTLAGKSLGDVAVELASQDLDALHAFEKGDPAMLPSFVSWMDVTRNDPRKRVALSITVNADRHYNLGLILAYLLANTTNRGEIMSRIARGPDAWAKFPDDDFLRAQGGISPQVQFIVFYNRNKSQILRLADATTVARELLLYRRQGLDNRIQTLLNRPGEATAQNLKRYFSAFDSNVFRADNTFQAAKTLIENRASQGIIIYQNRTWLLSLATIIKLAI